MPWVERALGRLAHGCEGVHDEIVEWGAVGQPPAEALGAAPQLSVRKLLKFPLQRVNGLDVGAIGPKPAIVRRSEDLGRKRADGQHAKVSSQSRSTQLPVTPPVFAPPVAPRVFAPPVTASRSLRPRSSLPGLCPPGLRARVSGPAPPQTGTSATLHGAERQSSVRGHPAGRPRDARKPRSKCRLGAGNIANPRAKARCGHPVPPGPSS